MVLNSAPGGSTDLVSGVCVCGVHACVRACVHALPMALVNSGGK